MCAATPRTARAFRDAQVQRCRRAERSRHTAGRPPGGHDSSRGVAAADDLRPLAGRERCVVTGDDGEPVTTADR